jgi:PIN domain nuclease of toxin-antitoxin system
VRCLLDTCTFLWLNLEPSRLSPRAREIIAHESNLLWLSAASAWEIAAKHRTGQLLLPVEPLEYVPSRRAANGIVSLRFREDDALQITKLPALHKDPFDRMLIGQAISRGLTIVTPDSRIRQYPVATIW